MEDLKDKTYTVDLEPYLNLADSKGGLLSLELSRLKYACILLTKHNCYREYPMKWVAQNLQSHSLQITKKNPIFYSSQFVHEQLQFCLEKLSFLLFSLLEIGLFEEIANIGKKMHTHLKAHSSIPFGFDYIIEVKHAN